MKSAYFDTNAFVDVFEDREPEWYPTVQGLVRSGAIGPVASDVVLGELVEGSQNANFGLGITRFFTLDPCWILAGGALGPRNLLLRYFSEIKTEPIELMPWQQAVLLFLDGPEILKVILRSPHPDTCGLEASVPARATRAAPPSLRQSS